MSKFNTFFFHCSPESSAPFGTWPPARTWQTKGAEMLSSIHRSSRSIRHSNRSVPAHPFHFFYISFRIHYVLSVLYLASNLFVCASKRQTNLFPCNNQIPSPLCDDQKRTSDGCCLSVLSCAPRGEQPVYMLILQLVTLSWLIRIHFSVYST